MKKYGIEHFHIELIEETDNPEEREVYWIEQKRSFKEGYNATIGGDGKKYLDYDLIISTYNEIQNIQDVAKKLNCNEKTVRDILKNNNIQILSCGESSQRKNGKIINQYDLTNNFIQSFPSGKVAGKSINKPSNHILQCANGKRKTAYGFIWKFAE
jgi:intein-encoded DNA endonuclease-like protein